MIPFVKDKHKICQLRIKSARIVNPYRKISFNNLEFRIEGVPIRGTVQLRIVPDQESGLAEIRFWYENRLVSTEKVKNEDLKIVHFKILNSALLKFS